MQWVRTPPGLQNSTRVVGIRAPVACMIRRNALLSLKSSQEKKLSPLLFKILCVAHVSSASTCRAPHFYSLGFLELEVVNNLVLWGRSCGLIPTLDIKQWHSVRIQEPGARCLLSSNCFRCLSHSGFSLYSKLIGASVTGYHPL